MALIVRMPEVLTGMQEASLVNWLVKPGEAVVAGQVFAEVETEKAIVEYEAEVDGTLAGYLVELGQPVTVGTPIAVLAVDGESVGVALRSVQFPQGAREEFATEIEAVASEAVASVRELVVAQTGGVQAMAPAAAPPSEEVTSHAEGVSCKASCESRDISCMHTHDSSEAMAMTNHPDLRRRFITPSARRVARERGIDPFTLTGTGPSGRIVRRDVDAVTAVPAALAAALTPLPVVASSAVPAPPTRRVPAGLRADEEHYTDVPHTNMRRAIARRLIESKTTIPHFYLSADCRIDELIALRGAINEKLPSKISINDFVVKAVAAAFQDVPEANAIWIDGAIRRYHHVDIAVAVAMDGGLVTPVVRQVEKRPLSELSRTIAELAARGREGRLKQHELEGGAFSISNLGMYGIEGFSAIINPPHSGILAVGAATRRPAVVEGQLGIATIMSVTLSGDHRVLDGALAARWLNAFVSRIENPLQMLV